MIDHVNFDALFWPTNSIYIIGSLSQEGEQEDSRSKKAQEQAFQLSLNLTSA